jgi:hypothetical protein
MTLWDELKAEPPFEHRRILEAFGPKRSGILTPRLRAPGRLAERRETVD